MQIAPTPLETVLHQIVGPVRMPQKRACVAAQRGYVIKYGAVCVDTAVLLAPVG
jgi:hypothetical protein